MMNTETNHHDWTDRLSDYLDGSLPSDERGAVEEHLTGCGPCRRVLEELRDVVARAADLQPIHPPRDLWGGIAATIQAPAPKETGAKVLALPVRGVDEHLAARPRFAFSGAQVAAASVALIVASSLATLVAGPGLGGAAATGSPVATSLGGEVTTVSTATPPVEMAEELALLEETLHSARTTLDPNTVRILERNLAVIETAIEDSRQALLQDPDNAFLSQHLERVFERKLTYLRDAARVTEWAG